ncbi:MAG: hypothetical protein ACE5E4_11500, partial [Candidatus Binatia bacterium]
MSNAILFLRRPSGWAGRVLGLLTGVVTPSVLGAVTLSGLLISVPAAAFVIDFENFEDRYILAPDDLGHGILLSVSPGEHQRSGGVGSLTPVVIESGCGEDEGRSHHGDCSHDDHDHHTPGHGIGNNRPQGKVMVLAKDVLDVDPADGLVDGSHIHIEGGLIALDFSVPMKLISLRVIGVETDESGGRV